MILYVEKEERKRKSYQLSNLLPTLYLDFQSLHDPPLCRAAHEGWQKRYG